MKDVGQPSSVQSTSKRQKKLPKPKKLSSQKASKKSPDGKKDSAADNIASVADVFNSLSVAVNNVDENTVQFKYGRSAESIDPDLIPPDVVSNFVNGTAASINERKPIPELPKSGSVAPSGADASASVGDTLLFTGRPDYTSTVCEGMDPSSPKQFVTPEMVDLMNTETERVSKEFNKDNDFTHEFNDTILIDLRQFANNLNDLPAAFVTAVEKYTTEGCSYMYIPGHTFTVKIKALARESEITIAVGSNLGVDGEMLSIKSNNINGAAFVINGEFNREQLIKSPNARHLYNHIARLAINALK